jgi:hypothetical protein
VYFGGLDGIENLRDSLNSLCQHKETKKAAKLELTEGRISCVTNFRTLSNRSFA